MKPRIGIVAYFQNGVHPMRYRLELPDSITVGLGYDKYLRAFVADGGSLNLRRFLGFISSKWGAFRRCMNIQMFYDPVLLLTVVEVESDLSQEDVFYCFNNISSIRLKPEMIRTCPTCGLASFVHENELHKLLFAEMARLGWRVSHFAKHAEVSFEDANRIFDHGPQNEADIDAIKRAFPCLKS